MLFKKKKFDSNNIVNIINEKFKIKRYFSLIVGIFLMAISFNIFFLPNTLVFGGIGGLTILINKIFGINIYLFMGVSSLLFLLFGFIVLDKKKVMESFLGSILFPIFIYLTSFININIDLSNLLLVSLLGGLIYGTGLGIVLKAGLISGGTDILKEILSKYFKISINTSMFIIDGIMMFVASFFVGITSVMYALISLYVISIMIDKIVLGVSDSKAFYIITDEHELVSDYILNTLGHGVTILNTKGAYTKDPHKMMFVVVPTVKYFLLKEGIHNIDDDAFFIATDAYEVVGGLNAKR